MPQLLFTDPPGVQPDQQRQLTRVTEILQAHFGTRVLVRAAGLFALAKDAEKSE